MENAHQSLVSNVSLSLEIQNAHCASSARRGSAAPLGARKGLSGRASSQTCKDVQEQAFGSRQVLAVATAAVYAT